jgi:hypothetical protein
MQSPLAPRPLPFCSVCARARACVCVCVCVCVCARARMQPRLILICEAKTCSYASQIMLQALVSQANSFTESDPVNSRCKYSLSSPLSVPINSGPHIRIVDTSNQEKHENLPKPPRGYLQTLAEIVAQPAATIRRAALSGAT